MATHRVREALAGLDSELATAMLAEGRVVEVGEGTELLKEGSYVHELPLVIDGLVRVYIAHEEKELLLYYIQPRESCVMSFSALLEHAPSRINAVVQRQATLLLLPGAALRAWLRHHPSLNALFFRQYNERYLDMVHTVTQVAFGDLPGRLMDHLARLKALTKDEVLDIRHAQLAQELGSAREVITRTLSKLEREGWLQQLSTGIRLLR